MLWVFRGNRYFFFLVNGFSKTLTKMMFSRDTLDEELEMGYMFHQTFLFSQTCSLNMCGKTFDTMGSPYGVKVPDTFIKI